MPPAVEFRRFGRTWHPCIDTASELDGVLDLDDALWTVTAAPVSTLRADTAFLAYLDADRDGRIRADEVRAAVRWLLATLADRAGIRPANTVLRLSSLSADADSMSATARWILQLEGTPLAEQVSLDAVRRAQAAIPRPEPEAAAARTRDLAELERVILYQAWMLPFVNSFVTCHDLYRPGDALFGWGTLVLDGRWFRLAVYVPDPARHEVFTRLGALCVMYVQVARDDGAWDYEVAIPVTTGMRGLIVEGMWGIFLQHDGRQRHACVRALVLHPISLLDAIVSPFRRFAEALEASLDKAAAVEPIPVDAAIAAARSVGVPAVGMPAPLLPSPPSPASAVRPAIANSALALAAGAGLALAAITSAITYIGDRLVVAASGLGAWVLGLPVFSRLSARSASNLEMVTYPVAVLAIIIAIVVVLALAYLVPVAIAAWLKLRRRDLGTLLIGSGWAVNTRLYVTHDVVNVFTGEPCIPRAQRRW